ncbi:DNA-binding protein [Porphyromonas gingivicanis]|uniref:DNA-binding protein n=1 Tax=Porphyromonas gingivicanis TaxID=266762 RepID=A0A0A2G4G5_9PORP|nr:HU family DNA-binding protein [Porphyromonas gingivicanis]KGN98146.1 DNA-binding protein [Porphyromonas gingivicanis]
MTKADLVVEIAKKTGLDRDEVLRVIESFMETVKEEMAKGEGSNIYLRGFGSFVVRERAQKVARNISKKESIIIPKRRVPSFKPSKVFVGMFEEK